MALAEEELRRAGFVVTRDPFGRRIYRREAGSPIAIVRSKSKWYVGDPYVRTEVPGTNGVEQAVTATPVAELAGPFKSWKAALICYDVTYGVQ